MTEPKRVSLVWLMLAALVAVVIVFDVAYASGDEVIQSNDMNNQTAGDINAGSVVGGNDAFSFGHSLGDVDLNQCMGSTQWGTILISKQKLVLNKWCAAESYDARGLTKMAALLRCDIPEISKHFSTQAECLEANIQVLHVEPMAEPVKEDEDEHTDDIEALYARLIDLEAQRQSDTENARKAAIRANTAAREAEQAEDQRKEYAQQMYEELKEWN